MIPNLASNSEKFRLNGSLARETLLHLHSKGLIREVSKHNSMLIYTRVVGQSELAISSAYLDVAFSSFLFF